MAKYGPAIIASMTLLTLAALGAVNQASAAQLFPVGTIPLGQVTGPIADLALDYANQRLIALESDAGAIAVIDLSTGAVVQTVGGLPAPRGLAHEPPNGQLYAALGDGTLAVLQGLPLRRTAIVKVGPGLAAPYYDPGTTRVYLGYGHRAIAAIDTAHDRMLPGIALDGDPGPLAFETSGTRLFAGALGENRILLADRAAAKQLGSWSTADAGEVAALALDEDSALLVATFRQPPILAWFDLANGSPRGRTGACAEPAKLIPDSLHARLYLICGEGRIESFQRDSHGNYAVAGEIVTERGATAAVLTPTGDRLYLAVPAAGAHKAQLRIYATAD